MGDVVEGRVCQKRSVSPTHRDSFISYRPGFVQAALRKRRRLVVHAGGDAEAVVGLAIETEEAVQAAPSAAVVSLEGKAATAMATTAAMMEVTLATAGQRAARMAAWAAARTAGTRAGRTAATEEAAATAGASAGKALKVAPPQGKCKRNDTQEGMPPV
uniref:Uncharacterized protein n=1 Tax=Chrysotila carterae TaxID=13221 RepID=A0A7S4F154_CHRCT